MSSEQNKVILRAEHISKTYGEKKVLEDISIYLEQGELVSSTLIRRLLREGQSARAQKLLDIGAAL